MTDSEAHYPRPAPIDAYGNGGFRFAGMSHKGSLMCLPAGIFGWAVGDIDLLVVDDVRRILDASPKVPFVLLGAGRSLIRPSLSVRQAFAASGIGLEVMDTGAACRTYNVLLAEGRTLGAALIAVE